MIKEMLKTAGVDNIEDFYKLHPTEEHFFKTYPHMKGKVKKGKKIRRPKAAMGGYFAQGGINNPGFRALPDYVQEKIMDNMANGGYTEMYAKGGIHINPAKKGTFTAQATRMGMGVQEAARHILAHKDRYSPGMVKKANFARNASKWKHQDGGPTGQEQMMQIIQAYAQMANVSPEQIIKKLQSLPEEQQQAAIEQMMQAVQPQQAAYGGYMYQEGGQTMGQEQMEGAPQQMQEQAMGQEQQQGGQEQMMQQLAQMVAQALQQGMPPEQIVQMLVQQGVPQEVAMQVVQMVMQQLGGGAPQGGPGQQYQPQGDQYQGPQGMQQGQPQAAYGGYYADGGMTGGMFFNQSYMPFDY